MPSREVVTISDTYCMFRDVASNNCGKIHSHTLVLAGSHAAFAVLRQRRDNERGERAHHLRTGRPADDRTHQDPQLVGRPRICVSFDKVIQ